MSYTVVDTLSLASGAVNEDRAGSWGDRAWVIDGATDLGHVPLTRAASDASWFADEFHELLYDSRRIETGDVQNVKFPRAKTSDDATGLLLTID